MNLENKIIQFLINSKIIKFDQRIKTKNAKLSKNIKMTDIFSQIKDYLNSQNELFYLEEIINIIKNNYFYCNLAIEKLLRFEFQNFTLRDIAIEALSNKVIFTLFGEKSYDW